MWIRHILPLFERYETLVFCRSFPLFFTPFSLLFSPLGSFDFIAFAYVSRETIRLAFYTAIVSCETEKAVFSAFLGCFLLKNPLFYLENKGFLLLRLPTPIFSRKGKNAVKRRGKIRRSLAFRQRRFKQSGFGIIFAKHYRF